MRVTKKVERCLKEPFCPNTGLMGMARIGEEKCLIMKTLFSSGFGHDYLFRQRPGVLYLYEGKLRNAAGKHIQRRPPPTKTACDLNLNFPMDAAP
jgi:hypothetical protein